MALIICKNCGKSISDKSNLCIHCGASTAHTIATEAPQNNQSRKDIPSYNLLTKNEREALKEKFIEECSAKDSWLRRYILKAHEIKLNSRCCFISIIAHWGMKLAYSFFGFLCDPISQDSAYNLHSILKTTHECAKYFTWIFLGILVLYTIVSLIFLRVNISHLIFKKKLQKWLRDEKQMEYSPAFKNEKMRQRFSHLDLNKI